MSPWWHAKAPTLFVMRKLKRYNDCFEIEEIVQIEEIVEIEETQRLMHPI
jgi:hypothetical protein